MTRARLIEAAIVGWFEQDGWRYDAETGEVSYDDDEGGAAIDLTALAAHLDVEWDRLSAGTA
jgi:hypothetical protein